MKVNFGVKVVVLDDFVVAESVELEVPVLVWLVLLVGDEDPVVDFELVDDPVLVVVVRPVFVPTELLL